MDTRIARILARDPQMDDYLKQLIEVATEENSLYTPDFVAGVQHGVAMMRAFEAPDDSGPRTAKPEVREAARAALDARDRRGES